MASAAQRGGRVRGASEPMGNGNEGEVGVGGSGHIGRGACGPDWQVKRRAGRREAHDAAVCVCVCCCHSLLAARIVQACVWREYY